jgi:hypothetical protein
MHRVIEWPATKTAIALAASAEHHHAGEIEVVNELQLASLTPYITLPKILWEQIEPDHDVTSS